MSVQRILKLEQAKNLDGAFSDAKFVLREHRFAPANSKFEAPTPKTIVRVSAANGHPQSDSGESPGNTEVPRSGARLALRALLGSRGCARGRQVMEASSRNDAEHAMRRQAEARTGRSAQHIEQQYAKVHFISF